MVVELAAQHRLFFTYQVLIVTVAFRKFNGTFLIGNLGCVIECGSLQGNDCV